MYRILAADIGATNSRFALFTVESLSSGDVLLRLRHEHWLKGADHPTFAHAVAALKKELAGAALCDMAVLALAGPIEDDCCRISNLPWHICRQEAAGLFGTPQVVLMNDFEAQGRACLIPDPANRVVIQPGSPAAGAPIAVIGAGTGLGKALLVPPAPQAGVPCQGSRLQGQDTSFHGLPAERPAKAAALSAALPAALPASSGEGSAKVLSREELDAIRSIRLLPSEGGHSDFPFTDTEEFDFGSFLLSRGGRRQIIGDAVISGSGLGHLYAFMTGFRLPDHEVPAEVTARRPEVLARYARLYGRACRNYVLETLALGGLYITGGMALRLPVLTHPEFLREFRNSAAHARLMENVPVYHIQSHQTGLWGAALNGLLQLV